MYHQDYDDEELDGPRVSVVDRVKGFFAGLRHNNDDLDEVSSERPTGRIYDIGTKDRVRITTHPEQTISILTVYEFNDAQKVADRLRAGAPQLPGSLAKASLAPITTSSSPASSTWEAGGFTVSWLSGPAASTLTL